MPDISNLHEFSSLYKIPMPVERMDYWQEVYLPALSSQAHPPGYLGNYAVNLERQLEDFADLEENEPNVRAYKNRMFEQTVDALKFQYEYGVLERSNYPGGELIKFDKLHSDIASNGFAKKYLSLDLREANWSIFQSLSDYLDYDWEAYLTNRGVHPAIARSKSFRQLVMGHIHPKKTEMLQHEFMMKVYRHILGRLPEGVSVIRLLHDEVVIAFHQWPDGSNPDAIRDGLVNGLEFPRRISLRSSWYMLDRCRVRSQMVVTDFDGERCDSLVNMRVKSKYLLKQDLSGYRPVLSLFGVPGNMFYPYYMANVNNQAFTDRHCDFTIEDGIARMIFEWAH